MIIVYSNTPINQQAVAALLFQSPQKVFSLEDISSRASNPLIMDSDDKVLTIIDLNANGNLQKLYSPKIMAQRLQELGFLEHIETIQLLVSDIYPQKPMLGFATDLSRALVNLNPQTHLEVKVPADVFECMLITPPEEPNGDWRLYAAKPAEIKGTLVEDYTAKMHLKFSGALEEVLHNPDYTVTAERTRKIYGDSEEVDDDFELKV